MMGYGVLSRFANAENTTTKSSSSNNTISTACSPGSEIILTAF
jgi:hypothetical protein